MTIFASLLSIILKACLALSILKRFQSSVTCPNITSKSGMPRVYWLNLEKTVDRRHFMQEQMHYYGLDPRHRVKALMPNNIHIPHSIAIALPSECLRVESPVTEGNSSWADDMERKKGGLSTLSSSHIKATVRTLCGRPKNSRREFVVTASHLKAIRTAAFDKTNHYEQELAIIMEDDVQFGYDVDWQALLSTAPLDFGILQLFTSNEFAVSNLWKVFLRHKLIWVKRVQKDDYWCAGAYIINRTKVREVINGIIRPIPNFLNSSSKPRASNKDESDSNTTDNGDRSHRDNGQIFELNIIAGYQSPCWPKYCCKGAVYDTNVPGCVNAPRGYQSDHFLFSIFPSSTYMLTVPMMYGSMIGNISTVHQEHIHVHNSAFHRIKRIIKEELFTESFVDRRPAFISNRCEVFNYSVDASKLLIKTDRMVYDSVNLTAKVLARKQHKRGTATSSTPYIL